MHNLGTVFNFEVGRTLKKKTFWIMAFSFPLLIGAIFGIIFFSNKATNDASAASSKKTFSLAVTDTSGTVSSEGLESLKAQIVTDKQRAIKNVTDGKLDAYFYYPKNLATEKVEIYAKDVGLFDNGRYQSVAEILLQQSAQRSVDPQVAAVLEKSVNFSSVTYKDGQPFNGFLQLIAPGIFLVLFYLLIAMFGSQMLTSTTEEKENRVIEMILTTIEARTLIIGKIFSLIVLALIQVSIIMVPVIIGYIVFREQLALPNLDLSNIPLDPMRIGIAAILFGLSFMLFTGLLVAIGAASPTAKEAGGFFGIVMMLIFGPLYAVTLFISAPTSSIVTFLSFFPLTAPIPLLLRNAVGNLSYTDALIGIAILAVSATVMLMIAVRLFRYGALEYSKRLSFNVLLGKK